LRRRAMLDAPDDGRLGVTRPENVGVNLKKGDGVLDQCRVAAAKTCPAVGRLNDVHRRLITVEIAAGLLPRGPCLAALGAALERFVDPLMESSELRCLLFDVIVVTHEGRVRAA